MNSNHNPEFSGSPSSGLRSDDPNIAVLELWTTYRLASQAQAAAFAALMVFAALAAYMAHLGQPWLSTLFGAFDVATIVGLFLNSSRVAARPPHDDS